MYGHRARTWHNLLSTQEEGSTGDSPRLIAAGLMNLREPAPVQPGRRTGSRVPAQATTAHCRAGTGDFVDT
jgi:hypothetical protein